jgi:hypothetical protein
MFPGSGRPGECCEILLKQHGNFDLFFEATGDFFFPVFVLKWLWVTIGNLMKVSDSHCFEYSN